MAGYLSNTGVFFRVAAEAYHRSKTKPIEALTCVVFSAFGLEAFMNVLTEFLKQGIGGLEPSGKADLLGQVLGQFDDSRENLTARIQVAKSILSGRRYDPGAEVFQDISMLLKVRNALVHPRPQKIHGSHESKDFDTKYPTFIDHLRNKGLVAQVKDGPVQSWHSLIETSKTAKWAYETSCSIIEDLINSFPDSTLKQMLKMMRPDVTILSEEPQI